ncbi:hypothetical protein HJFPF1_03659 [Paramyrothecium foliicola]|nr:hypothetical protein HJFPF1_03659 [Paramyrothecium foliicola]
MKFSLASASGLILALASSGEAWKMRVHEQAVCSGSQSSYYVEGTGGFRFDPWVGKPWNGYIKECTFFWDYGNKRTTCDGYNKGWYPRAVKVESGTCWAVDHSGARTQLFVSFGNSCNLRTNKEWAGFYCED